MNESAVNIELSIKIIIIRSFHGQFSLYSISFELLTFSIRMVDWQQKALCYCDDDYVNIDNNQMMCHLRCDHRSLHNYHHSLTKQINKQIWKMPCQLSKQSESLFPSPIRFDLSFEQTKTSYPYPISRYPYFPNGLWYGKKWRIA